MQQAVPCPAHLPSHAIPTWQPVRPSPLFADAPTPGEAAKEQAGGAAYHVLYLRLGMILVEPQAVQTSKLVDSSGTPRPRHSTPFRLLRGPARWDNPGLEDTLPRPPASLGTETHPKASTDWGALCPNPKPCRAATASSPAASARPLPNPVIDVCCHGNQTVSRPAHSWLNVTLRAVPAACCTGVG